MAIKVVRTILSDVFTNTGPLIMVVPIFLMLAMFVFLPMIEQVKEYSELTDEQRAVSESIGNVLMVVLGIAMIFPIITTLLRTNVGRIIKTANIEKRMEKLKKLGTAQFVKQTKATLIDSSPRGNKLYASEHIIKDRTLKFLIYSDKSTDREYISFVKDEHINADAAMASKFSLDKIEYERLRLENEA